MCVIYRIRNLINNKMYIGKTEANSGLRERYQIANNISDIEGIYLYHLRNKKYNRSYNRHLFYSIKKYGFQNWEVIREFDKSTSPQELIELEKHWISELDTYKNGYNETEGGEGIKGYKFTEEQKDKISGENGNNSKLKSYQVIDILNLRYKDNYPYYKIAEKYSLNKQTVGDICSGKLWKKVFCDYCKKNKVELLERKIKDEDIVLILDYRYNNFMTYKDIAKIFNVDRTYISNICNRKIKNKIVDNYFKEKNIKSLNFTGRNVQKLSDCDVLKILDLRYKQQMKQVDIAKIFDIGTPQISEICSGKKRKDIYNKYFKIV